MRVPFSLLSFVLVFSSLATDSNNSHSNSSARSIPGTPSSFYRNSRHNSTGSISSLDEDVVPIDRLTVLDLLDSFSMGTHITKKLNTAVRQRGGKFKTMALRQRDRVMKVREDDVEKLKLSFLKQVSGLEARLTKVLDISITEKMAFAVGLLTVFYGGYIIGYVPQYFHLFYTIEMAILLPVRVFTYRYKQYQYFLADLCYFVNFLTLLFIWVFPSSKALFTSCYALTFGTLSWAVITWRNSLVLHSIEKTTSSAIHILPPVVFHVITHMVTPEYKAERFPGAVKVAKWSMLSGLMWASVAYLVWQSLYHYFITVRRQDKIKAGRATSFEYLRKSYRDTKLGKFVNGLPEPFPVVAFTLIQYGYQLGTMILCPLWYGSSILSGLFMTFIFFAASYNGATYYIDIFGKRFQKELLKLEAEIEKLNSATAGAELSPSRAAQPESSGSEAVESLVNDKHDIVEEVKVDDEEENVAPVVGVSSALGSIINTTNIHDNANSNSSNNNNSNTAASKSTASSINSSPVIIGLDGEIKGTGGNLHLPTGDSVLKSRKAL